MAGGKLTNAEMRSVINAGGSVDYNGRVITKLADLPTDSEIGGANTGFRLLNVDFGMSHWLTATGGGVMAGAGNMLTHGQADSLVVRWNRYTHQANSTTFRASADFHTVTYQQWDEGWRINMPTLLPYSKVVLAVGDPVQYPVILYPSWDENNGLGDGNMPKLYFASLIPPSTPPYYFQVMGIDMNTHTDRTPVPSECRCVLNKTYPDRMKMYVDYASGVDKWHEEASFYLDSAGDIQVENWHPVEFLSGASLTAWIWTPSRGYWVHGGHWFSGDPAWTWVRTPWSGQPDIVGNPSLTAATYTADSLSTIKQWTPEWGGHTEMVSHVNAGGTVVYKGVPITNTVTLPTQAVLDAENASRAAAIPAMTIADKGKKLGINASTYNLEWQ